MQGGEGRGFGQGTNAGAAAGTPDHGFVDFAQRLDVIGADVKGVGAVMSERQPGKPEQGRARR